MKGLLVVLCFFACVEGYTIEDQAKLHTNITSGYDRRIRPGIDRSAPLQIDIKFFLASLKEFSQGLSKIGVVGSLSLEWTDSRLSWSPTDYSGDLHETTLFISDIWTPFLVLMNPFDKVRPVMVDGMSCKVYESGRVSCLPPDLYEATCDADVTYYPFDSQTCALKFYVPALHTADIILRPNSSTFDTLLYEENGLWSIKSTRLYYHVNVHNFEELRMEINMKRRAAYYIVGLLLPIALMNFLQILVFVLPVESGERMGFSITVLLAVAVFLTIIQDKLPEASEPNVSGLTYKLLVDMLIGCAMVVAVVFGMNFYHKSDDKEIPAKLKRFTRSLMMCCKRQVSTVSIEKYGDTEKTPAKCVNDNAGSDVECNVTWNDVGLAFDKLCIIIFLVLLISSNFIYVVAMAVMNS